MAKSEKPAAPASQAKGQAKGQAQGQGLQQEEAGEGATKSKRKKLIFVIVGVLALGIAAGAGWYFTKGSQGEATKKAAPVKLAQPKFIPLEAFTVNLQRDGEGDQFLQIGITLEIDDPALEEKIKQAMPKIRSRILMLLSGKRASELVPISGKKQLAQEVLLEANTVLGFKPAKAKGAAAQGMQGAASGVIAGEHAASGVAANTGAAAAPSKAETAVEEGQAVGAEQEAEQEAGKEAEEARGILGVLFTSFIIQ